MGNHKKIYPIRIPYKKTPHYWSVIVTIRFDFDLVVKIETIRPYPYIIAI